METKQNFLSFLVNFWPNTTYTRKTVCFVSNCEIFQREITESLKKIKIRINDLWENGWMVISNLLIFLHSTFLKYHWHSPKSTGFDNFCKNKRKMRIIDFNFQIKQLTSLACRIVWNWPSKLTKHSRVFVKCKCPNCSYSGYKPHYLELIHSNKFWPKSLKNGALVHISMHIHLSFLCPFFLEGQHFWMLCLLILRGLFSSWPLFSWCIDTGCLKSKVYDING